MAAAATASLRRLCAYDAAALLAVPTLCCASFVEAYSRTDISDADAAGRCRHPAAGRHVTPKHVRQLERDGFVVLEGPEAVLRGRELRAAQVDTCALMARGRFARSCNDSDVRQDLLCWIREDDGTKEAPDERARRLPPLGGTLLDCVRLLRGVAQELEECGYCRAVEFRVPKQLQLAWYPGDGASHYVRHLDACLDSISDVGLLEWWRVSDYRERAVTAILYLNDECWDAMPGKASERGAAARSGRSYPGGELRLFRGAAGASSAGPRSSEVSTAGQHADIVPNGGTLVLFDSRVVEHQVIPTWQDRFALTVWIVGKPGAPRKIASLE